MIKIPFRISQVKNQKKLKTKKSGKFILGNKIVNKNIEPTLFNVQNAAMTVATNLDYSATRTVVGSVAHDLPTLSTNTLIELNIGLSNLKEDFSLLEDNKPEFDLANPAIISSIELSNTNNETVKPKGFVLDTDPFYELDDERLPAANINDLQNAKDFIAPIDPSQVLAGINVFNQSTDYFGKNKYYL